MDALDRNPLIQTRTLHLELSCPNCVQRFDQPVLCDESDQASQITCRDCGVVPLRSRNLESVPPDSSGVPQSKASGIFVSVYQGMFGRESEPHTPIQCEPHKRLVCLTA